MDVVAARPVGGRQRIALGRGGTAVDGDPRRPAAADRHRPGAPVRPARHLRRYRRAAADRRAPRRAGAARSRPAPAPPVKATMPSVCGGRPRVRASARCRNQAKPTAAGQQPARDAGRRDRPAHGGAGWSWQTPQPAPHRPLGGQEADRRRRRRQAGQRQPQGRRQGGQHVSGDAVSSGPPSERRRQVGQPQQHRQRQQRAADRRPSPPAASPGRRSAPAI